MSPQILDTLPPLHERDILRNPLPIVRNGSGSKRELLCQFPTGHENHLSKSAQPW